MKPVRAEFVVRRGPSRALWAMLLCGLALLVVLVVLDQGRDRELGTLQARVRDLLAATALRAHQPVRQESKPYEASAREMLALHGVQWPIVFAALETAPRDGIAIHMIDFDAGNRVADAQVVAEDHRKIVEYVDVLNAGLPAGERAWWWTVLTVQRRTEGGFAAHLRATWSVRQP